MCALTPKEFQMKTTQNLNLHLTGHCDKMISLVKCGVRTHAHFRVPELKSGALDRSANLTSVGESETFAVYQIAVP